MYRNNQGFTFLKNEIGKPSLEDYEYETGKKISRYAIQTLSRRLKKLGAVVAVDKYHVKKFKFWCNIYKVMPSFGYFVSCLLEAIQKFQTGMSGAPVQPLSPTAPRTPKTLKTPKTSSSPVQPTQPTTQAEGELTEADYEAIKKKVWGGWEKRK